MIGLDWTAELIAQLRACWAEGLPVSEIARRLHCTKNAVVGKVHRLELPARPSPIRPRRDGRPMRRPAPRPVAHKPAAPAHKPVAPPAPVPRRFHPARAAVIPPAPAPVVVPPPVMGPTACTVPPLFTYAEGGRGCGWVERPWRVGDLPGANLCGKPRRDARCPYCPTHAKRAFQPRVRPTSEVAAAWT